MRKFDGAKLSEVQFQRVSAVVKSCRKLGVKIPMLSIENSQSLLADCIEDPDMKEIMGIETMAFARTGGAMYGQRPPNRGYEGLPCATLKAQVRHTHVISEGLITLGVARR